MVAHFLLNENWHFFAFLCSTDTPSIKYHGRLLGPGPLFGTREYLGCNFLTVNSNIEAVQISLRR